MYDVIFMLVTALIGFVFSYIVVTMFNVSGRMDAALGRDLQQMGMQIITIIIATVFLPLKGVWNTSTDLTSTMTTRAKWVVAFGLFTAFTFLMHYYHAELLSIFDDGWTCTIVPILRNIVTPVLQFSRVLFALGTPLLNAYLVIVGQVVNAWYITLAKCSHIKLFRIFTEIASAFITGTVSIKKWFGADGVISDENNFYYNDFEIAIPVNHTMNAVAVAEEALACACKRFEPLFGVGLVVFREPHVVAFIDNGWQTLIRAFQMIFRILLGDFPDIEKVAFKLERAVLELGLSVDGILFKSLNEMVNLFDTDFKFTVYPKEAMGTIWAHGVVAVMHAFSKLAVNLPLHVLGSFKSGITPFDPIQWSLEKSLSHVHSAVYSSAVLLQWLIYVLERLMTDTIKIGEVFTSPDTPLTLECDWAKDVEQHSYVTIGYTSSCSLYYAGIAWANLWYIGYGVSVELLTKSIFAKEPQNVFRTFQRWEGPMLPRNKVYDCEARKAITAYNYVDDVYNEKGWVWTQDLKSCNCERSWGDTTDEGEPYYNPWCGQVSLNFDVFAPMDALVMHLSHGILGPGFGDAFPFIDPIQNIEINIPQMGVEKSIALPFPLPPLTRTAIESVRVLTRVALSFGDIVTGHFFNYPVNCGHGLNMTQLRKRYEIEYNVTSEGLDDSEMRWRTCDQRKYSAVRTSPDTCDSSNEASNCMCSYLQPLQVNSKCMCIARYPDLDITVASQQAGDLIEKRFTSEDVSIHWCNSMLTEWTFQNTAAFADALDYMVSLAPINPSCDVVDRLLKGEGFSNAADNRSSSVYLIADTPTLDVAEEFTSADDKLSNIKNLYATSPTGCAITPGGWVDAKDENGNPVLNPDGSPVQVMTEPEWSCDASQSLKSIAEIDPIDMSDTPGCRIWGRTDFFCSAGLFVRNYKRLTMNLARQVVNDGISVMSGNFADVNLKTLPRVCDYERVFGSIAAMGAGIIPGISTELKQAFAKYINMALQIFFIQGVRTVLTLTNIVTTMVMDFVSGSISKQSVIDTFDRGVKTIVRGGLWAWRYFWETTGEILDAISPGAGSVCDIVVDITDIIIEQLEQGLMDVVQLGLKVFFQFIAALTGDEDSIGPFFANAFALWAKIQLLVIQQMWTILAKIFEFFGPVGTFFKILASIVCNALNFVFSTIDSIIRGLCLGFCDGIGWEPMKCVDIKHPHTNHTSGRLGKHFLGATDNKHLPRRVAEALDWNGTSVCDHFMTAAADYSYTELRPLERAKWIECIEMKLIGVELAKFAGSKTFPTDIMYNWKSKYVLLYDLARATKILLQQIAEHKTIDWVTVRFELYEEGLDADMYIRFFQNVWQIGGTIIHNIELTNFVTTVFEHIDPDYDKKGNPSSTAKAWSVYQNTKSIYTKTTSEWTRRDATKEMWKAIDASYNAHTHLHQWWSAIGTETTQESTHTEKVFENLKRSVHHAWHEKLKRAPHVKRHKPHWLRTPLKTDIKNCSERGSPMWCTDCNIADNLIETLIEQGTAVGDFYSNRFPLIINDVGAYFDNLGEYNSDFFDGTFSRLTSTVPKTHIRWTYHVARDWSTLWDNFTGYIFDMGNDTKKEAWLEQVDAFLAASRTFVTLKESKYIGGVLVNGTNGTAPTLVNGTYIAEDSYVPFYGYSFHYMYNYVIFSKCNMEESIYVTEGSTEKERIERIDTALIAGLILILVIITNTTWSIIPLVWLANVAVIGVLVEFLYLYIVYGYAINCAPLIPNTLLDDINAWYHSRIQPDCFYKALPYLAVNASEDTCLTCSTPPSYLNCGEYTAANFEDGMLPLKELIEEYNIFWPALFWIRWQLPSVATFFVRYGILPFESVVGRLAMSAWQNEPIDPVWVDCYYAMWLDNVLAGILIAAASYVTVKLSIIMVQFVIQLGVLTMFSYTTLSYMSLAVEQSVALE